MKLYITFGQGHCHVVDGKTLNKDTIAELECSSYEEGRQKAFNLFGCKWSFDYQEADLGRILPFFPAGIVKMP